MRKKEVEDDGDRWVCFPRVMPPFGAFQILLLLSFFLFAEGIFTL